MFPTPIPTDRYEVVGWKWTMTGYVLGEKRGSFGKTDENGDFFKDSYKTLLTFFNKDIEMF